MVIVPIIQEPRNIGIISISGEKDITFQTTA
jgi:hypothetical protein